jgi:hypothetical protein
MLMTAIALFRPTAIMADANTSTKNSKGMKMALTRRIDAVCSKRLPRNHFQRIALRGNRRKPPVRIEKSELPHRPHTRESCCHNSDSHKFVQVAIFRGARKPIVSMAARALRCYCGRAGILAGGGCAWARSDTSAGDDIGRC